MTTSTARMLVAQTAKKLGIELPRALQSELKAAADLQGRVLAFLPDRTRDDLTTAVLAELKAKRDPLESPAVQRAVLAFQISNAEISSAANHASEDIVRSALLDNSDDILATWSQALDPDADDLMTAAEQMGDVDLNEVGTIRAHPVAYGMAMDALERFEIAAQGAQQLAALRNVTVPSTALYFLDADDAPRLHDLRVQAARHGGSAPSPYLLACNGIRPTFISTVAQLIERNGALAAHQQGQREAEDAARKEFIRLHH